MEDSLLFQLAIMQRVEIHLNVIEQVINGRELLSIYILDRQRC